MSRAISLADVVAVPISSIIIGPRRREKLGRLQILKKSIAEHGLIHPILLRGQTLIAGHRRLEACRLLEWKTIPARQLSDKQVSDEELRALELDENTAREGLSDYATSKQRLAQIRQAEADLKAKAKAEVSVPTRDKNPKPNGRPRGKTAGSKRSVEEETGIPRSEQVRIERHVELAERYPFMQRAGWGRAHVLDAGDALEKIPADDRSPIAALLDQDGVPPALAIEMLTHAVEMPTEQRQRIIDLAQSSDPFERRTAGTKLAAVPTPPDPGLLALHEAVRHLTRSVQSCRSATFRPRVTVLSDEASTLLKAFSAAEKEARDAETV